MKQACRLAARLRVLSASLAYLPLRQVLQRLTSLARAGGAIWRTRWIAAPVGADWEQPPVPNCAERLSTALNCTNRTIVVAGHRGVAGRCPGSVPRTCGAAATSSCLGTATWSCSRLWAGRELHSGHASGERRLSLLGDRLGVGLGSAELWSSIGMRMVGYFDRA